jgi:hypothetical protein
VAVNDVKKEWFEMRDVRRRTLQSAVWIPLRAIQYIENVGNYGTLGFKEEFFGAGCVAVPLAAKGQAGKLGWTSALATGSERRLGGGSLEVYVAQALSELTFEGLPNEGLKLDDDCIICPVTKEVLDAIEGFRQRIGDTNIQSIAGAGAVNFLVQTSPTPLDDEQCRRLLLRTIVLSQQFLLSLWLVKDNSANTGEAHLALVDGPRLVATYGQHAGGLNFTADCDRVSTPFTKEEVNEAVAFYRQLEGIIPTVEWKSAEPRTSGLIIKSRFLRALYFAQAARASADIGVKIAFYCICFESLFSTDRDALSHRIAERAAVFIETAVDRRTIYQDIKTLYGIRSTVVHGDPLNKERLAEFREIAKKADGRIRRTFQQILADPTLLELFTTKNSAAIESHFLDRLFPPDPPAAD